MVRHSLRLHASHLQLKLQTHPGSWVIFQNPQPAQSDNSHSKQQAPGLNPYSPVPCHAREAHLKTETPGLSPENSPSNSRSTSPSPATTTVPDLGARTTRRPIPTGPAITSPSPTSSPALRWI